MNSVTASHLVRLVQKNGDLAMPIKPQLQHLFIPAFWNGNLVVRNSWQGKIARFFQYPSEYKSVVEKIERIFAQAIDQADLDCVDHSLGIKLRQEFGCSKTTPLSPALAASPEIEALTEAKRVQQHSAIAKQNTKKSLQLLLKDCPQNHPIEFNTFRSLFEADFEKDPHIALDHIELYLKRNPQEGHAGWQEKLPLLRQAFKRDQALVESYSTAASRQERHAALKKSAASLCDTVHKLGDRQKTLFHFSFGAKTPNLSILLNLFKQLPKSSLDTMPEQLKALISSDTFANPKKAADELIHRFFENIPKSSVQLNPESLSPLFENPDRQIPESIAAVLPKLFETYLEHPLKKGVLGTAASLTSDPLLQKALDWISRNGQTFLEKGQPFILQAMEKKLKELLHGQFDTIGAEYLGETLQLFKESRHLLSPQGMEVLGLDHGLIAGPLWLEVEKGSNHKFNLSAYALGNALNYHPTNPNTGKPYQVLRLTGIQEDKLNEPFFYSLLKRHLEPQAASKASDIYLGPLTTLEAAVAQNPAEDRYDVAKKPATARELSLSLLLKNPKAESAVRWDALINLCKTHCIGDVLDVPDRRCLEKALNEIEKELVTDQQKEIVQGIRQALHTPLPVARLPKPINDLFSPLGFSNRQLKEYQGVIRWALGDEVADAIDQLAEQAAPLLPEDITPVPLLKDIKDVSQESYIKLYFDTALQALGYATALAGFLLLDIWEFLNLSVLFTFLPTIIPQWLKEWTHRIVQALQRKLGALGFLAALYLFTTKETREQLQAKLQAWKQSLQDKARTLIEGKKIHFALSSPLTPNTIPISSATEAPQVKHDPFDCICPRKDFDDRVLEDKFCNDWSTQKIYALPSRYEPLRSPSLEEISSWGLKLAKDANLYEIDRHKKYLVHHIDRLEIPSHNQQTCWDTVEKPEEYIEGLSELFLKLGTDFRNGGVVLSAYKILAIMDRLARRCPDTHLQGFKVNAYPLLKWLQNRHALDDPFYLRQLHGIVNYLLPDIDLDNLPPPEEIEKRAQQTLFSYHVSEEGFFGGVDFTWYSLNTFVSKPEQDYYEMLAKDPKFATNFSLENAKKLLFEDAFHFRRQDPLISTSFSRLRLQNLICNAMANNQTFEHLEIGCPPGQFKNKPFYTYFTQKAFDTLKPGFLACSYIPEEDQADVQSKAMGSGYFRESTLRGYKLSEKISLVLDYINKNTDFDVSLDQIFDGPGELKRQIEQTPQLVPAIVETLNNLIDHHMRNQNSWNVLSLVGTGLKIKHYCEYVLPNCRKAFPDFAKIMELIEPHCQGVSTRKTYLFQKIKLLSCGKSLSQLSIADQKQGVLALFEYMMLPSYDCNVDFSIEYSQWIPVFNTLMNDHAIRDEILNALLPKIAHDSPFSEGTHWERIGALYFQRENVTLNIPHQCTIGLQRRYFDLETVKKHPSIQGVLGKEKASMLDYSVFENKFNTDGYQIELKQCPDPAQVTVKISKTLDKKREAPTKPKPIDHSQQQPKSSKREVPQHLFKEGLEGLSRFCPLDKIKGYAYEGENHLSEFTLGGNLNFRVSHNEAQCAAFPGFHLSETQAHPAVDGIASYLLLEDQNGKKMALVPKNQWAQAMASRLTKLTGPLSKIALEALAKAALSIDLSKPEDYFCFEIEGKESPLLNSSDPEALTYLMTLYYFQGKRDALDKTLQRFEWACNIRPLQDRAWTQLLPLLLIPMDFEGVVYFRRRMLAAMAQNQRLLYIPSKQEEKPGVLDLVLGIAILRELDQYQKEKNPRQRLSIHQEFFLYECALDKLGAFIAFRTHPRVKKGIDRVGYELLMELSGLSKTLAKRYGDIRKAVGLGGSSRAASVLRLAAEFNAASSSIPEVLMEGKSVPQRNDPEKSEAALSKLARVFAVCRNNLMHHLDELKLEELFNEMDTVLVNPVLDPSEITPDMIKKHFPAYYTIAKFTDHSSDAKRLTYALKMMRGMGDPQCQILMAYLEAVLASPRDYPSVKELFSAREKQESNYRYALKLATPHYKSYPKWYEFFNELNIITFGETLGKEIVEPAYHNFLLRTGTYQALGIAASHVLPTGAPALVQLGVNMTASAVTTSLAERGIKLLQPIKNILPSPTSLTANLAKLKNASWSKTAWAGAKVLAPLGLLLAGRFAYYAAAPEIKPLEANSQSYVSYWAFQGLTMVGAAFIRLAFAKAMKTRFTLTDAVGPYLSPVLHSASKLINRHKTITSTSAETKKPEPRLEVDYSILEEQDQTINTFLSKQFSLVFDELPAEWEGPALQIPEHDGPPLLKEKYKKANASLKAYREDPNSQPSTFRVHNEKALLSIYVNLLQLKTALTQQVDKERLALLNLFNTAIGPHQTDPAPLALNAIHQLIDQGDLGEAGKQAGLSNQDLPQIELAAVRIDHKTSRLHQIERLIQLMDTLPHDRNSPAYAERLEQLAIELRATTAFPFKEVPSRLLRKFLRFQAESHKMLWNKQAATRKRVLIDEQGNLVTEELPGSGKTDVGIPLTAEYLSNGSKLVSPIFPRQLAGDNMPEVHRQLWNIFGKRSHVLQSKREMDLNIKKLEGILVLLHGAILEGEPVQMTKEDAQAFQSIFFDRMHCYRHTPGANTPEEKQCLILLKKILKIFRSHGVDIPDEAHETYSYRKQLNYPIGSPKIIDKDLYMVAEVCMRHITRDPEIEPLIATNQLTAIDKKHYKTVIKPRLARLISKHNRFKILEDAKREEFIAFVCDQGTTVPKWISSNIPLYREASMVKGILNDLLPKNFKKRTHVDFGPSKEGRGEFSRPSDGNSHVLESDSIRLAYEALIKTFLMLGSNRLTNEQGEKLYNKLKDTAKLQMLKDNLAYTDTLLYRKFGELFPTLDEPPKGALDKLCRHSDAVLLYMRHFIRKEILYWKYNIQNTTQDYDGIYGTHYSCSGTPYNFDTYPANKKLISDPTTLGEALEILSTKCPEDGIHLLQSNTPAAILNEILHTYFMPGSTFSALIDGGAQFTGMDNAAVAKIMADFCSKHRPDIKAVKYYRKGNIGQEEVACIRIGKQDGELKPEQCLSYYDQRHGFGSNIPQKGDGLCTLGPNHPLFKLIQEILRIRGLKRKTRLKQIEERLIQIPMQKIHLAMTNEVLKMIMDRDPQNPAPRPLTLPTLEDIIDYAIRNEAAIAKEENYPAMLDKYHAAPRQTAYDKIMLDIPDEEFEKWMGVYDEFETTFVSELVDDPIRLWGKLTTKEPNQDALTKAADSAIGKIKDSPTFTSEEKIQFQKHVKSMPLPPMQEKVPAWREDARTLTSLGLQQTVEQTALQTAETENDQEQDQDTQRQNHAQNQWKGKFPVYKECDWPAGLDPLSVDWLQFNSTPFFKVQDLLAQADDRYLSAVSSMFDPRLWMSNNFVHHRKNGFRETSVQIGSREQMHLYSVLVHLTEENGKLNILHVGPLTIREQAHWRERFKNKHIHWNKQKIKTLVWNPAAGYVIAGYPCDREKLRHDPDLKTLIGQLKFLNGDVRYPNAQQEITAWIKKHSPAKLNEAYDAIYRLRQVESMQNKDIDHIFMNAREGEIFYEEQM